MWRLLSAGLLAFGLLAGCSDDSGESNSGGGGEGGEYFSGPRGALNLEVYAADQQTCPPGNVHLDIGTVNASPPIFVYDGISGAGVTCTVKPTGQGLGVTSHLTNASNDVSVTDMITDAGVSAVGIVRFVEPASGAVYSSPINQPCVFQFAPGTDQTIEAGRVFVQFDCGHLVNEADATQECAGRYGYLHLEGCDTK